MALADYISSYNKEALPEIELQRKLLREQLQKQQQQEQDALQRALARAGGGPSGAGIKLQQQQQSEFADRAQQAETGLMVADISTKRQLAEAEKQREFAKGERIAGQEFAGAEGLKQREFAGAEAEKQRTFQKGLTDTDLAFRQKVFEAEDKARIRQMDTQEKQFSQSMELERRAMEINKWLAEVEAGRPTDLLGSLFGPMFSTAGASGSFRGMVSGALGGAAIGAGVGSIVPGAGTAVGAGVGAGIGAALSICFVKGTMIKMAHGKEMAIERIKVGDKCLDGGVVKAIGKAISDDVFDYKGVMVTGSHAVVEDGIWKRVKDTKHAKKIIPVEFREVYYLSNRNHLILIGNTVFADYEELDNSSNFSDEEIIVKLNQIKKDIEESEVDHADY